MKVYHLKRAQVLPISIQEAWSFFSSPANLGVITPARMKFNIISISGGSKMYAGQLIRYKIQLFPWWTLNWVTEITHVSEPHYFVDDQRFGPYALWHHQHTFREVPGGTEMTDELHYAVPFGILGQLANWLFVEREVYRIFDFRFKVLETFFEKKN
jgi:ligand-binding SRPBCC domain-containing protein